MNTIIMFSHQKKQPKKHQTATHIHCTHSCKSNTCHHCKRYRINQATLFRKTGFLSYNRNEKSHTHHKHTDIAQCRCYRCFKKVRQHNFMCMFGCPSFYKVPQHTCAGKMHYRTGYAGKRCTTRADFPASTFRMFAI